MTAARSRPSGKGAASNSGNKTPQKETPKKLNIVFLSTLLGISTEYNATEKLKENFSTADDNAVDFEGYGNGAFKAIHKALKESLLPEAETPLKGAGVAARFTLPNAKKKRGSDETAEEKLQEYVFQDTPALRSMLEDLHTELAQKETTRGPRSASGLDLSDLSNLTDDIFNQAVKETREKVKALKEKGAALAEGRKAKDTSKPKTNVKTPNR